MTSGAERVSGLGEFGLIERFQRRLPPSPDGQIWSGDDAAVVPGSPRTVVTTDVLVEGIDFDLTLSSPSDAGWKALAANVSDVAAMGGEPTYAVVALTMPADTQVAVIDELLDGMLAAAARWEVALVGGDVSEGPVLSVAVTLLGAVERPVLRSGAQEGDAICVTGSLGGAAGGLLALRRGAQGEAAAALIRRQVRPEARVEAGLLLADAATAMIDVSDGFLADLSHLLDASARGCDVDPAAIPIDPNLKRLDLGADPLELALTGGEDFELLATVPPGRVEDVAEVVTRVGTITKSGRTVGSRSLEGWEATGWEHLRP